MLASPVFLNYSGASSCEENTSTLFNSGCYSKRTDVADVLKPDRIHRGAFVFSLPSSCSPALAVWLHWPFAAPSFSAPAPPVRPAASVAAPVASVEPRGAALADPDAADSHSSGWLKGNI